MNSITPLKIKMKAEQYDCLVATQTHTNIVAGIAKKLAGVKTRLIFREVSTPSKNLKLQGLAKFLLKTLVNWTYPMAQQVGFLIRSFKALHDQHPETRLLILGEGELRAEFEALVAELGLKDVVDLPGFDANPYAYFKYASLFVLSSNWEGLPGVLIQALASKVKVVSTNCPSGPMEILENSKFGLLVECNDQAGLTQAMQQAIFADYVQYQDADFESHIQQFHKQTVLKQYLRMMESAA